uniref:GumC family protein n=1 Tax=Methylobacterium sp. TaxID=409 RepID=UPI0020C8C427|nr:Wzz/FepE/Etk N-terminal domain-containing protein [Methylobacterium sp.]USU34676.1 Wzz/FepE/Etk N-terminal domain-containing protein [Methylobacterium sp.]
MYNPAFRANFAAQPPGPEKADLVGIQDVGRFLRAAYRTILATMLAFTVLGAAFCLVATPTFTGTAQILIETDHIQSFFQDSSNRRESETETGRIESQIEVIKSDRIAEAVIRKQKLLDEPEFSPPAKAPFYAGAIDAIKGLFKAEETPLTEEDIQSARMNVALDRFTNRLTVRRIGQSFVAEVTFRSNDAGRAASITNALLKAYIDADIEAKAQNARRGHVWLTERLGELRAQVTESRRAVEEFKSSGEIQSSSERAVKLAELDSVSQSQSRLYDVFLQRLMETAQKVTYPVADARIISSAAKPTSRSFPKTGLIVAFMGLLGAAAGVGIAMVRSTSDRTVRSLRQIGARVDCDVLGVVTARPRKAGPGGSGPGGGAAHPLFESVVSPRETRSHFASDFRSLKVSVNTALLARSCKRIGITSLNHGEGKTTVACNLAALFACSGTRILLVDLCDGDRSVKGAVAPDARFGLAEAIQHPDMLPRLLVPHGSIPNLSILPLGTVDPTASPAEQLASNRHRLDMDALGQGFDLLLFDLPGIKDSPDALALAPSLDAIILVVEYGRTTTDEIEVSLAKLQSSNTQILGLVVNKADTKRFEA